MRGELVYRRLIPREFTPSSGYPFVECLFLVPRVPATREHVRARRWSSVSPAGASSSRARAAGSGPRRRSAFAAEGARVGLVARDLEALREVANTLSGRHVVATGDLSTPEGVDDALGACLAGLGGVDILVNNAGSSPVGTIDDLTDAQWRTPST